jgi:hypothetical protein
VQFGQPPNPGQLFNPNSNCGQTNDSSVLHQQYCALSGQNLTSGWDTRRNEWQFGLGIQHELLPRLSGEVTFNRRAYANLTDGDTLGRGCDYFIADATLQAGVEADPMDCFNDYLAFQSTAFYDFYSVQAPPDARLPNGGNYVIRGNDNQAFQGGLPNLGTVTTINQGLEYTWNGVDTNFVYRGQGGLRVSGGTSTGRSLRNTCLIDGDTPNVKGREGNLYGGGCAINNRMQTNIRANASYTIPWVDVLVGAVYQFRPGANKSANLDYTNADVTWEPSAAARATLPCDTNGATAGGEAIGCFFTGGGNPTTTANNINLLDFGDIYDENIQLWDLNFQKNIRFAGKRVNFGVQIYNLFNSDAITSRNDSYDMFRLADGTWVEDNPNTADVEVNEWDEVTGIVSPRFLRFSIQFNF